MELGQMIALRRKEAKMTIDELVAKSGIPKGTLNKIIAGTTRDPQLETVKAIARALNCTLDDFDDAPRARRLSAEEFQLIQNYRLLDRHGKSLIKLIVVKELERCSEPDSAGPAAAAAASLTCPPSGV